MSVRIPTYEGGMHEAQGVPQLVSADGWIQKCIPRGIHPAGVVPEAANLSQPCPAAADLQYCIAKACQLHQTAQVQCTHSAGVLHGMNGQPMRQGKGATPIQFQPLLGNRQAERRLRLATYPWPCEGGQGKRCGVDANVACVCVSRIAPVVVLRICHSLAGSVPVAFVHTRHLRPSICCHGICEPHVLHKGLHANVGRSSCVTCSRQVGRNGG